MHLSIHAVIIVRNCMNIFWTHYTPTQINLPMYLSIYAEEQQVTQCWISIILSSCYTFLKPSKLIQHKSSCWILQHQFLKIHTAYLLFLNVKVIDEEKIVTIVHCEAATLRYTYQWTGACEFAKEIISPKTNLIFLQDGFDFILPFGEIGGPFFIAIVFLRHHICICKMH